jgi:hypothetical protein
MELDRPRPAIAPRVSALLPACDDAGMSWPFRTGFLALAGLAGWTGACGSATGTNTTTISSTTGTGGHGGQASGTGGALTVGSGGASSSGSGGASATGTGGAGGCTGATKLCGIACVATDDPATGCAGAACDPCVNAHGAVACAAGACAPACDPGYADCNGNAADGCEAPTDGDVANCGGCGQGCAIAHANAGCALGVCTVASCDPGYADCNGDAEDGCEVVLDLDADNCGACGRACAATNVASRACAGGVCTSTCVLGKGNCAQPAAPAADDGCELDTSANSASCGGCGNACTSAMFNSNPSCDQGQGAQKVCGCSTFLECEFGGHTAPTCSGLGRCVCNGATCQPGEACHDPSAVDGTIGDACTCYGGAACAVGQTCCQTPLGCFDLQTDPASCGACGHACAPGFGCEGGVCSCKGTDAACDGGGAPAGSFTCPSVAGADVCVCGGTTCAAGQRCRADGTCG